MSKKILLVVNPYSKVGSFPFLLSQVKAEFTRAWYDVDVHMTTTRGDGMETARKMAGSYDIIVACGGDGTFNEVVTGVYRSGLGTPVGLIPCGTGNVFASSVGISTLPMEAARAIARASDTEKFDLGSFDGRFFTFIASFGVFTETVNQTPQPMKHFLGQLAYVLEGINDLPSVRARRITLTADGVEHTDDYIFGAVANSTQLAGLFQIDPRCVSFGDGLFEVMLIRMPANLMELGQIIKSLSMQLYDDRYIDFFRASRIEVTNSVDCPWSLDGDRVMCGEKSVILNLHNALTLVK